MTLDELKNNWRDYAIERGDKIIPLKSLFAICLGEDSGGLLFDTGNKEGDAYILKSDENDNCYQKVKWDVSDNEGWKLIGKFVRS